MGTQPQEPGPADPGRNGHGPPPLARGPLLGDSSPQAWAPAGQQLPLGERVPPRPVLDPLSAAEIAISELEAIGVDVWDNIAVDLGDRVILTADEIHAFRAPPISTLPFLGRPGLVREGAANLLYSYPKTGKTELLTAVIKEWAGLGMKIFYVTEESFGLWKERLEAHGLYGDSVLFFNSYGSTFKQALDVIEANEFDVLVVDTLRNTLGYLEGEGDKEVARVIHPLLKLVQGKTSLCSYHARKMPGDGGRDISGHHSLYGAFDRALQLTPVNADDTDDTRRKVIVSGRCMYEGDKTLLYTMESPGHFEVLDGATVVKERKTHTLTCLECGDSFESKRSDTKTCSDTCRARKSRRDRSTKNVDA